jgi:hypothetical protein
MSGNSNPIERQTKPELKEQHGESSLASNKEVSQKLSQATMAELAGKDGHHNRQDHNHGEQQQKFGDYQLPDLKIGGAVDVKAGDTMWGLSERILEKETGRKASGQEILQEIKALQKANPEITDPNKIYIGEHIKIPGQGAAEDPNKHKGANDSTGRPAANDLSNQRNSLNDSSDKQVRTNEVTNQPTPEDSTTRLTRPAEQGEQTAAKDSTTKLTRPTEQEEQTAANDSAEQHKPQSDNPEPIGWTVAVNLSAEIDTKYTQNGQTVELKDGEPHILNEVEKLKQDSIGKPDVTFVVQYADHNRDGAKDASANGWYVHRLVIKDGQMVPQEQDGHQSTQVDSPSQGYAQDITGLLKSASPYDQGSRLAFVNQSHGDGMGGVTGGNETVDDTVKPNPKTTWTPYGTASPDELVEAVKQGLGNRQKLDLLDLDCCMEGEGSVLGKLKSITDDVVASAQEETAGVGNADGQNLRAPLNALLNNPNMTGSQLGDSFVQEAQQGANNYRFANGIESGTSTLAHYDLTKLDGYNRALDNLGGELTNLVKNDTHNQEVIQGIMNQTFKYGHIGEAPGQQNPTEQRGDILQFLEKLSQAENNNQLDDPTHKLSSLINNVGKAEDQLVKSYYGQGNYKGLSGLAELFPTETVPPQTSQNSAWLSGMLRSEFTIDKQIVHTEKDGQSLRPQWIEFLKTMNKDAWKIT